MKRSEHVGGRKFSNLSQISNPPELFPNASELEPGEGHKGKSEIVLEMDRVIVAQASAVLTDWPFYIKHHRAQSCAH